jgi:hypothetical protein
MCFTRYKLSSGLAAAVVDDPVASAGDAAAWRSTSIVPRGVDAVFALFAGDNPLVGGYFRDAAATASTATATGGGDEAVESDIDGSLVVVADGGDGADMMMLMKDAESNS